MTPRYEKLHTFQKSPNKKFFPDLTMLLLFFMIAITTLPLCVFIQSQGRTLPPIVVGTAVALFFIAPILLILLIIQHIILLIITAFLGVLL